MAKYIYKNTHFFTTMDPKRIIKLSLKVYMPVEVKTKGYDIIGINVFLRKLMKFLRKKPSLAHSQLKIYYDIIVS